MDSQFSKATFAHLPGSPLTQIFRRLSVIGNASLQIASQPQLLINPPEVQGHQHGEEPGCQFNTPFASAATVIFPANHGTTQSLFSDVIIHRNIRIMNKPAKPFPMVSQAFKHLSGSCRQSWTCKLLSQSFL